MIQQKKRGREEGKVRTTQWLVRRGGSHRVSCLSKLINAATIYQRGEHYTKNCWGRGDRIKLVFLRCYAQNKWRSWVEKWIWAWKKTRRLKAHSTPVNLRQQLALCGCRFSNGVPLFVPNSGNLCFPIFPLIEVFYSLNSLFKEPTFDCIAFPLFYVCFLSH